LFLPYCRQHRKFLYSERRSGSRWETGRPGWSWPESPDRSGRTLRPPRSGKASSRRDASCRRLKPFVKLFICLRCSVLDESPIRRVMQSIIRRVIRHVIQAIIRRVKRHVMRRRIRRAILPAIRRVMRRLIQRVIQSVT
jgi:hypothetical protein